MIKKHVDIGDSTKIKLKDFGIFTVTCHAISNDVSLFIFDDCVTIRKLNGYMTNQGGFENSDLKKWMVEVLLPAFPDEIKEHITELTIPSYGQIFGHDDFYKNFEPDEDEQLPLMEIRKNRIADYENKSEWYWLRNATKKEVSSAAFALVDSGGDTAYYYASDASGIRPEFWLDNCMINERGD